MVKILINHGYILTNDGWINDGYLTLDNGKITEVGLGEPTKKNLTESHIVLDANHCAVLPGLTNAHTHLSQTFMRGLARGRSLISWLEEVIWPIQVVISPEELYMAALLGLVENLRCGAVWVTDHHKIISTPQHTDAVLKAAREIGLRFTLARAWSDQGNISESPDMILGDLDRLFDQTREDHRIKIASGPLTPWRCSAKTLQTTQSFIQDRESFTHIHVSESQDEVQMSLNEYGLRPVEWLESIGVLGVDTQIVHAVWVNESEIKLIAKSKASVIHCPVSNAILGSGVAPIKQMLGHGVEIHLGSDGPASNDTQDIWETLKATVSFGRATTQESTFLPPAQAIKLVTGGKTLSKNDSADLIIVDLNHPRVVPVQDIDSALVLGTHGCDVRTVIVGGQILMQDGKISVVDEFALYEECRQVIKNLSKRAGI